MKLTTNDLIFAYGSGSLKKEYSPIRGWRFSETLSFSKIEASISKIVSKYDFLSFNLSVLKNEIHFKLNKFTLSEFFTLKYEFSDGFDEAIKYVLNDSHDPFLDPLMHFYIFYSDKETFLVVKYNHALFDGYSLDLIMRGFFNSYLDEGYKLNDLRRTSLVEYFKKNHTGSLDYIPFHLNGLVKMLAKISNKKIECLFHSENESSGYIDFKSFKIPVLKNDCLNFLKEKFSVSENTILLYLIAMSLSEFKDFGLINIWMPVNLKNRGGDVGNLLSSGNIKIDPSFEISEALQNISNQVDFFRKSKYILTLPLMVDKILKNHRKIYNIIKKNDMKSHIQFSKNHCPIYGAELSDEFAVKEFISCIPPRLFRQGSFRCGRNRDYLTISLAYNKDCISESLIAEFFLKLEKKFYALGELNG